MIVNRIRNKKKITITMIWKKAMKWTSKFRP